MKYIVEFEPVGRRGECQGRKSFLDCARYLGLDLISICGGSGKCKTCKIKVLRGKVSEPTSTELALFSEEQLKSGWRLACLTYPESDCAIYVPPESLTTLQRMQVEGIGGIIPPEPAVRSYLVKMSEPGFLDLRSDASRLSDALETGHGKPISNIDINVLQNISQNLRNWNWQAVTSVHGSEIIALSPQGSQQLGLAIDLGSTKIAAYLMDLEKGETISTKGMMNPQISYGEDITSRMHYALKTNGGASQLQNLTISGLNQIISEICRETGAKNSDIVDAVIVGNTAMHHLLMGISVSPLSVPPFVAAVQDALDVKARDIGLQISPGAYIHLLPNIAGFIGADHVSMLLGVKELLSAGLTLALDIGTNTEVSLINKDIITSVSCASGPAFEGGHISCGMRAASGAIERLKIENGDIKYQTINGTQPTGICGSGIIDIVAQMYLANLLDESGRMQKGHPCIQSGPDGLQFTIYSQHNNKKAVTVSQRDIREVQLAKSAIRTGIQVLLDDSGRSEEEIERVIIAGAFGTYVDVESAITIGMLPAIRLDKYYQVGNAAGMGARQALLSIKKREEARLIAKQIRYIELASAPGFNKLFIQAQYLGKYRIVNGKRIKVS